MNVPVQKKHPAALLPTYAHSGDAGMDVYASAAMIIPAGQRAAIPTGIAMAIPQGYVGLVWDKSGLARDAGITTLAGVIDAGYRGEIQVVVFNTSQTDYQIVAGSKIAQLLIQPVECITVQEVSSLEQTTRGDGGFGSTGLT